MPSHRTGPKISFMLEITGETISYQVNPFWSLVAPFHIHVLVFRSNIFPTIIAQLVELLVLLRNARALYNSDIIGSIFGTLPRKWILSERSPLPETMLPKSRAKTEINQQNEGLQKEQRTVSSGPAIY